MPVQPGDVLRETYRIDALIGRGGMGQVFAATSMHGLERETFAIKVVSRLLVDEVMMQRLHREAEAAARIRSEHIPRVFEVADTEEGETFLVMERLVGEPLSQRMRERGPLPWSEVMEIGEDVLRGLMDAHIAGVIHRDLKPSNIFLALRSGRVRAMVLDFGVCKLDGVDAERLTGTGESIGTVAYMAPEQIRGASKVDERADIYAFGVLVFEMLTGRLPHEGPSQMAILASKLENASARLWEHARVEIPQGLDAVIARTLDRDPDVRFSSAQEVFTAWRALAGGPRVAPSAPPPPMPPSRPDDVTKPDGLTSPLETTLSDDAPTQFLPPLGFPSGPRATDLPKQESLAPAASKTPKTPGPPAKRGTRSPVVAATVGVSIGLVLVVSGFVRPGPAASKPGPTAASSSAAAERVPPPLSPSSEQAAAPAEPVTSSTGSESDGGSPTFELASPPPIEVDRADTVASAAPVPERPRPAVRPRPPPRTSPPTPRPSASASVRFTTEPRY